MCINNKNTENDLEKIKSLVKEMVSSTQIKRGRMSGYSREIDKIIPHISNQDLIELAQFLGDLMESTENQDDLLGSLLDNVLENITGTK